MDGQQIREITQMAFRAHFRDVDIVRVNVRRGFDHEHDPVVEVNIIYDGKYEQLNAHSLLDVDLEINHKVWLYAEDSPGTRTSTTFPSPKSDGRSPRRCSPARHRMDDDEFGGDTNRMLRRAVLERALAGLSGLEGVLTRCASTAIVVAKEREADALRRWDANGNGHITCREAHAHGVAPVRRCHPAYRFMRDGDGVACE